VQQVEQLALVFVDALDLHVEQRGRIDHDAEPLLDHLRQAQLVVALDAHELVAEAGVVGQRRQPPQLVEVLEPALAELGADQFRQRRIGLVEPAPRRDAVGHVDDLVRPQAVEVGEDGFLHQPGVDFGNAIDLVAADDGQVRHADALAPGLIDQRHALPQGGIAGVVVHHVLEEAVVDLVDDLQVARQHALEQRHRPGFQRLGHQRVVGVGEGARDDVPGARPLVAVVVDQDAHQFGHGDRGMGVVELHRHFVRQRVERHAGFVEAVEHVLQRGADEEVLLLQAQLAAHFGGVVGIEHLGEVFRIVLVLDGADVVALVEVLEVEVAAGLGRPQAHVVHRAGVVAGDRVVVGHRHHVVGLDPLVALVAVAVGEFDHAAVELHLVEHFRPREFPGVAVAQPVVGVLDLLAVLDALVEHAVFVADAVAVAGDAHGRHRIEEAGGEPAEAAVAERRVGLDLGNGLRLEADAGQRRKRIAELVFGADVEHAVGHGAPHEEFHGEVIDALAVLDVVAAHGLHPALDQAFAHHRGGGVEPVAVGGGDRVLADVENEAVVERAPDRFGIERRMVELGQVGGLLHVFLPFATTGTSYSRHLRRRGASPP